ncbi:MAG: amidohydrolase family protein [Candidatus Obscuribacterales bacterium]|nr:amidohydrolase family protein [Candidatus Obscuribacterales bacterium]
MSNLIVRGGHVVTPIAERFAAIEIRDGRIERICHPGVADNQKRHSDCHVLDASGCYVTPGLIDLQVNGSPRCNLWGEPTAAEVQYLAEDMLAAGVTAFLPTLITDQADHLRKNVDLLTSVGVGVKERCLAPLSDRARMVGIHLEGPCLSEKRPGVHPPQSIQAPSVQLFERIVNDSVRLVTLAVERDRHNECIKWLQERDVVVSLGHSNATLDEAQRAFLAGVSLMTHTFNALPPLHHREPGAVGAALLNRNVTCCVIADGLHLSPQAVELVYRLKKAQRMILVTDIAQVGTTGGGLVGSSITLDMAVRNVVNWGVMKFSDAITMSTYNPAHVLGLSGQIGSLHEGALADLVVWDKESLAIKHVIVGGKIVARPGVLEAR